MTRELHCADNLEVLRGVPSGSVGIVYLDPPFNTGRDWHMKPPAGSRAPVLAFTDKWTWTEDAAQQYKGSPPRAAPSAPRWNGSAASSARKVPWPT